MCPRGRRLEPVAEILRLVRHQTVAEFHDAHDVRRHPVIGQHEFAHPEIVAADNSSNREALLVRLHEPALLDVAATADALAGLRIVEHRVLAINVVLGLEIVRVRSVPMALERGQLTLIIHRDLPFDCVLVMPSEIGLKAAGGKACSQRLTTTNEPKTPSGCKDDGRTTQPDREHGMARLLSVNVGLPRDVAWQGRTVHTGIWKAQVTGPRRVRRLNIDGDGQGDTAGHGGEHRAVFVYQDESYRYWQEHPGRSNLVHGQFGENFTVEGLADTNVCIGDRYRIGSALFEVTQPRVTCYRLGIRMDEPDMAALLVRHGRPGFYFRVLEEGDVEARDEIKQIAVGPERMSVFEVNALLYLLPHPRERLARALRIPALSRGWQRSFAALLEQQKDNKIAGNAGLGPAASPPPAWRGFRSFRVARKIAESGNVTSLILEPADGHPVAAALPGQFVVIRLEPSAAQAMTRSYSLSSGADAASYRISIKREVRAPPSRYIADELVAGAAAQLGAPRGSFTLRPGTGPVVLLSAGIGVTPVLAMLHALAAEATTRDVWWLHGTRNGREHAFAAEARELLGGLSRHHSHVCYSAPDPGD